jgi:hypothetical protein
MKDEKYPDAVIICPASNVGEDEFQSKKSLPPKPSTGRLFFTFHFLPFYFSPIHAKRSSFIFHP